jgi:hypothetical protein
MSCGPEICERKGWRVEAGVRRGSSTAFGASARQTLLRMTALSAGRGKDRQRQGPIRRFWLRQNDEQEQTKAKANAGVPPLRASRSGRDDGLIGHASGRDDGLIGHASGRG